MLMVRASLLCLVGVLLLAIASVGGGRGCSKCPVDAFCDGNRGGTCQCYFGYVLDRTQNRCIPFECETGGECRTNFGNGSDCAGRQCTCAKPIEIWNTSRCDMSSGGGERNMFDLAIYLILCFVSILLAICNLFD